MSVSLGYVHVHERVEILRAGEDVPGSNFAHCASGRLRLGGGIRMEKLEINKKEKRRPGRQTYDDANDYADGNYNEEGGIWQVAPGKTQITISN